MYLSFFYLPVWCGAMYCACIYFYPDIIPLRGMPWRSPTAGPFNGPLDYLRGFALVYFISSVISPPFRFLPGNRHYVSLGPTCGICMALWTQFYSTDHTLLIPALFLAHTLLAGHPPSPPSPPLTTFTIQDGLPGALHFLHLTTTIPVAS